MDRPGDATPARRDPGETRFAGGELGAANDEVYFGSSASTPTNSRGFAPTE
ncbi:MAG: hypothetical protein R2862_05900 [Thermoanaerobaculia bacterium]